MIALPKHLRQSPITVDGRAHEIRGPEQVVRIVDRNVQSVVHVRDALRVLAGGEPASQDRFRGLLRWVKRNESEAAAHGGVHESDRTVRGSLGGLSHTKNSDVIAGELRGHISAQVRQWVAEYESAPSA